MITVVTEGVWGKNAKKLIIALASASGAVTTLSPSAQGAEGLLSGPDTSEKIHSGGRRPPEVTRHK